MHQLIFYVETEAESKELWEILHKVKGAAFEIKDEEPITNFSVVIYVLPTLVESGLNEAE